MEYLMRFCKTEEEAKQYDRMIFQSGTWRDGDLGKLNRPQIIERLCADHPDHAKTIRAILGSCNEMLSSYEDTGVLLRELHEKGYRLFYLTNTTPEAFGYIGDTYGYFRYFEGGIRSCDYGVLKPQPEIYRLLLKKYGLNPAESLFADDMRVNLEAAEREGIHTVCPPHPQLLRKTLLESGEVFL